MTYRFAISIMENKEGSHRNLKNHIFALSSNTDIFYFVDTGNKGLAIHIKWDNE